MLGTQPKKGFVRVPNHADFSFGNNRNGSNEKPFSLSCWFNQPGPLNDIANTIGRPLITKSDGFVQQGNNTGLEYRLLTINPGNLIFLMHDDTSTNADVGGVFKNAGNSVLSANQDLNRLRITSTNVPAINQWHHVVVTYDGTRNDDGMFIYIDGVDVTFRNGPYNAGGQTTAADADGGAGQAFTRTDDTYVGMSTTANDLVFGGYHEYSDIGDDDNSASAQLFREFMADVCVFNKALSAGEVAEVYNAGKIKDMTQASTYNNLISWWKMGDDQDSTATNGIKDYKGSHHGTLSSDAEIEAYPALGTDRIHPGGFVNTSWGRTRQPKNVAGDHAVYIHGGISGAMPKTDPSASSDGYATENQRFLHLRWKAEQTNKTHEITAYGYSYASGVWSLLHDTSGTQVKLSTTNEAVDLTRIFQISGIDRVYFKSTGDDDLLATDLFASAVSSF